MEVNMTFDVNIYRNTNTPKKSILIGRAFDSLVTRLVV